MSGLIARLEQDILRWGREEQERQDKAVAALVAILRDQVIEMEGGLLRTDDCRDGIELMKMTKREDRLIPHRLKDLIAILVEQNHGSLSMALTMLTLHLGETIVLIPASEDVSTWTLEGTDL